MKEKEGGELKEKKKDKEKKEKKEKSKDKEKKDKKSKQSSVSEEILELGGKFGFYLLQFYAKRRQTICLDPHLDILELL